jgi:hypothetical protein
MNIIIDSPQILIFELWLQILLDDVKVSEQLLDLVFYSLIFLGGYNQVLHNPHLLRSINYTTNFYLDFFHDAENP